MAFLAPRTIEDAVSALGEDAVAVAGGTSVALLSKTGLLDARRLVYLGRIDALSGIAECAGGQVRIGALTTLRDLSRSAVVRSRLAVLADAADQVGNPRVRAVATVGGAVAHADPRQDLPPVLLALDARVRLVGPDGAREVALSEFILGFMYTAIGESELITDIVVPVPAGRRTHYVRYTPGSESDYPTVGAAVALGVDAQGRITDARIAIGGAGSRATLAGDAAAQLAGARPQPDLLASAAAAAAAAANPSDDQRGSASYKRAMVEVWTRRALEACLAEGD